MATSNTSGDGGKAAKKAYIAKQPILHDGEPYAIGDEIELTDKQAKGLGEHVEPVPAAAAKK